MEACMHARECERTLSRAQRAPQTIMTTSRLKCSCNYKFRGAETTTIFATNEFTWFRQNNGGEDALGAAIGGARENAALKHQNIYQTGRI